MAKKKVGAFEESFPLKPFSQPDRLHPPCPEKDKDPGSSRGIDIATLPSDLLKQLKPHFSHWQVEDPNTLRYHRSDDQTCFFGESPKGWQPLASLSHTEFGQKTYAFKRKRPQSTSAAGGAAAPFSKRRNHAFPFTGIRSRQQKTERPVTSWVGNGAGALWCRKAVNRSSKSNI